MSKFLGVTTTLDTSPPSFVKRLTGGSRRPSMKRARRSSKEKTLISLHADPGIAHMSMALSELEHVLIGMAANKMRDINLATILRLRNRSGKAGGLKSNTLKNSWRRTPAMYGSEVRARSHFSGDSAKDAGKVGTILFGYGIYTNNSKFLDPISASSGMTDLLEILEYGSRPHRIKPKSPRGRLRFQWDQARSDLPIVGTDTFLGFFGQGVNHPGTRPYGFTRVAVAEATGRMLGLLYGLKRSKFFIGR